MRIILIIITLLMAGTHVMGQLPDLKNEFFLLADTNGVQYYLTDLTHWEGEEPTLEQLRFEDQIPKGSVIKMFRYSLDSEYVFSYMDESPLYHATMSDHYGCVIQTVKGLVIYTGDVGREWCWELAPPAYQEVLHELSAKGVLQEYLGVGPLMEYLGRKKK